MIGGPYMNWKQCPPFHSNKKYWKHYFRFLIQCRLGMTGHWSGLQARRHWTIYSWSWRPRLPAKDINFFFTSNKHERRGGGATYLSTLRQLSNPGYLWDVGLEDTAIVKHLKNVFLQFLPQSHNELMKLYSSNVRIADEYVDCVLFPETFIYHLQCEGMTREQADQAFTQQLEPSDHERQVHRQFKYGNSILFLRH